MVREERAPRGRLETWRADVERIEGELREKGTKFPTFETERTWIELEIAQRREGLGLDGSHVLSKVERAWRRSEEQREDEIPPSGPLAELEVRLRARETDAALEELGRLRREDFNHVIDAIGLMTTHGEIAARGGRIEEAIRLFECALDGYVMYASGASSGAEGIARTQDIKDMKERISLLKVRR